jgi:hypothetical protein
VRGPKNVQPIRTASFGKQALTQFIRPLAGARATVKIVYRQQAQLVATIGAASCVYRQGICLQFSASDLAASRAPSCWCSCWHDRSTRQEVNECSEFDVGNGGQPPLKAPGTPPQAAMLAVPPIAMPLL